MALYVIRPDNPPPGEDWLASVPGQYLYNVTGVYATLVTGDPAPTTMVDASGNGWDGDYNPSGPYPLSVPGLVAGNGAKYFGPSDFPNVCANAQANGAILDPANDFTVEFWMQMDTGYLTIGKAIQFGNAFPVSPVQIAIDNDGNVTGDRKGSISQQAGGFDASAVITDGLPHHYVMTFTALAIRLYIDKNELTPIVSDPLAGTVAPMPYVRINDPDFDRGLGAIFDEVALYPSALSGADVAAHYDAAGVSFDAYVAAVLADLPAAYYHMSDGESTGRQVTLSITDSNNETERVPSGFDPLATPGPYAWSWLPKLNSAAENATSATITVPLPTLLLPAGYTIGTKTLDIESTDQWSDIAIWWNSDAMDASQEFNPYAYPPGATLVYQQIQGPS